MASNTLILYHPIKMSVRCAHFLKLMRVCNENDKQLKDNGTLNTNHLSRAESGDRNYRGKITVKSTLKQADFYSYKQMLCSRRQSRYNIGLA